MVRWSSLTLFAPDPIIVFNPVFEDQVSHED